MTTTNVTLSGGPINQVELLEQIKAQAKTLGIEKMSAADMTVFAMVCRKTGLDPFTRQIHAMERKSKNERGEWVSRWLHMASIDGLRLIAQRSGEYAGQEGPYWCGGDGVWKDVWLSNELPRAAKVGVMRTGFNAPLYAVAVFEEYAQYIKDSDRLNSIWNDKPALMIAKCAEALALRKAFPNEMSGIYEPTEIRDQREQDPPRTLQSPQSGASVSPIKPKGQPAPQNPVASQPSSEQPKAELPPRPVCAPGAQIGEVIAHRNNELNWLVAKTGWTVNQVRQLFNRFETTTVAGLSPENYGLIVQHVETTSPGTPWPQADFDPDFDGKEPA